MKKISLILVLLTALFAGCKEESNNPDCEPCSVVKGLSQNAGQAYLEAQYAEIQSAITNTPCTDASKWEIIPIGSKACGGPTGYIAYNQSVQGAGFLKKVEDYTAAQEIFNKKWGVFSDCSLAIKPTKVECIDEKAKLIN